LTAEAVGLVATAEKVVGAKMAFLGNMSGQGGAFSVMR
jgi:hypothetical protein